MDSEKVIKRDNEYVLHTYNRNPVVLEKGHGLYAEGPEGQKLSLIHIPSPRDYAASRMPSSA